jgi:3-phosphoshikimate 1-carboxyvinyltransferase
LAQTLAVVCAGLGVRGEFAGLETLRIKETDRIAALQRELAKVGCDMDAMSYDLDDKEWFAVTGKANLRDNTPSFATYEDHRMAMAFAPLALYGPVTVQEPEVVVKSYPAFWEDLSSLGFQLEEH